MFKSMKRIIKWAGKYKGRLYLGSVFSFFSSLSTAIPTMAAAYALDKAIEPTIIQSVCQIREDSIVLPAQ